LIAHVVVNPTTIQSRPQLWKKIYSVMKSVNLPLLYYKTTVTNSLFNI